MIYLNYNNQNIFSEKFSFTQLKMEITQLIFIMVPRGGGGGGGGTQVERGAAPALRISRRNGSFWRPPHVRDLVKERYFLVPRYEVWGVKIPLQNIRGSDA